MIDGGFSKKSGAAIMLVEDDPATADALSRILSSSGYRVYTAECAGDAKVLLGELRAELIVLDLVLPDSDGLVFLSALRAVTDAPIIICSARERQVDRVLGLKLGADDFVAKPFDVDELEARVEAALRRASRGAGVADSAPREIEVGDLVISPCRAKVTVGGRPLDFTPTEYRLLVALATHVDALLSREELGQIVWGYSDVGTGHLIDVHIGRLRLKLRRISTAASPLIETVRGRGYRLVSGMPGLGHGEEPVGGQPDGPPAHAPAALLVG